MMPPEASGKERILCIAQVCNATARPRIGSRSKTRPLHAALFLPLVPSYAQMSFEKFFQTPKKCPTLGHSPSAAPPGKLLSLSLWPPAVRGTSWPSSSPEAGVGISHFVWAHLLVGVLPTLFGAGFPGIVYLAVGHQPLWS